MSRKESVSGFALAILRSVHEHDVKYPAAAFAYYGFVAFLPLLVLAVALLGESSVARVDETLPRLLTPEARRLVQESLLVASGRTGATVFAIAVLAWSGANMTVGFEVVVERVEGLPDRSRAAQLRSAVSVLASLCLAVVAVLLTERFFAVLSVDPVFPWWRPAVLLATLAVAFLPLYYLPSRVVDDPVAAVPGALTAAVAWTGLITLVQYYAANASQYALYGILSGIVLIFTSLYVAAGSLMLGIVVNATLAEGSGTA